MLRSASARQHMLLFAPQAELPRFRSSLLHGISLQAYQLIREHRAQHTHGFDNKSSSEQLGCCCLTIIVTLLQWGTTDCKRSLYVRRLMAGVTFRDCLDLRYSRSNRIITSFAALCPGNGDLRSAAAYAVLCFQEFHFASACAVLITRKGPKLVF